MKLQIKINRVRHILLIAAIIILLLIGRLIYLNTFNYQFLKDQMNARINHMIHIEASRGAILDRNMHVLAISNKVDSVWINPKKFFINYSNLNKSQIDNSLNLLAKILNLTNQQIDEKLANRKKTFVYLKRFITEQEADKIRELKLDGVYLIKEYKRFYPYKEVCASILGYTDIDNYGIEGIEYAKNKELEGKNGFRKIVRDRDGHMVDDPESSLAVQHGRNIVLSIDHQIQHVSYGAIKEHVEKFKAKSGSAVVLDAKSGEILAMVNYPSYDPNKKIAHSSLIRNRAVTDIYEPGSTMKPFIIALAMMQNKITPYTIFNTQPYYLGKKLIQDVHAYKQLNVTEILQKSSDVGTSKIAMMLSAKEIWEYYKSLGFGSKMNTGFPGEAKGILHNYRKWRPIDQVSISYGYSIGVSLLQIARSYTVFTNNGCLLPLTFFKSTPAQLTHINSSEKIDARHKSTHNNLLNQPTHNTNIYNLKQEKYQPNANHAISNNIQSTSNDDQSIACEQVMPSNIAHQMQEILYSVNTQNGSGKRAVLIDHTSAGKTGTAHKLDPNGRYYPNKYIASFAGFAPSESPKIIVAIMIDDPQGREYFGGQVAAPIFQQIASQTLNILSVKPNKFK